MTNNTTKQKKWLWLLPVAVLLIGAAALGLFLTDSPAPAQEALPAATPAPAEEPALTLSPGYFPTEGLLFFPEDPFTRGQAAELFSALTGREETFGPAAEEALTETALPLFLKRYFDEAAVEEAMAWIRGRGDPTVTRAEAVVCLNRLGGLSPVDSGYYPDVAPEYWARGDILAAAGGSGEEPLKAGFVNLEGWLYCVDDRGYFRKNLYLDSLYFDNTGRYTSGSKELDAYVAQAIDENTTGDMTREEMLRAMYLYVRDSFEYLRRNYYLIGDHGWQVQEALTMYSTGKGNCYCYSSAFWAAARGLGYNAKIVSGTIGREGSPHGWVEILLGGERYTFDVEIEMAQHRDGFTDDMYRMTDRARRHWNYVEYNPIDNMLPRETEEALQPQ